MEKVELMGKNELDKQLYDQLRLRRLPDYFLYLGRDGVHNWLALDRARDYAVTRDLTRLLRKSLPAWRHRIPEGVRLVSIGVGGGDKEKILLAGLSRPAAYFPVDISSEMVDEALKNAEGFSVSQTGVVAFLSHLGRIRALCPSPALVCLLGNTFCNYEPGRVLETVRKNLGEDDFFLMDCHLFPANGAPAASSRKIEAAYRSQTSAHFNLEPLYRLGAKPDQCRFQLDLITVLTEAGPAHRTYKHIKILKDLSLRCHGRCLHFRAGETLEMGFTYFYSASQIFWFLKKYGLEPAGYFQSHDGANLLVLTQNLRRRKKRFSIPLRFQEA